MYYNGALNESFFMGHDPNDENIRYYYVPVSYYPSGAVSSLIDYNFASYSFETSYPSGIVRPQFSGVYSPLHILPAGGDETATNAFTEHGISYDRNGNLLSLKRYGASGSTPEDDFIYEYDGNRLVNLITADNPSGYAYEYDFNGNMTMDGLNALKLEYNSLNLTAGVRSAANNAPLATYRWLADGTKTGVKDAAGTQSFEYTGSLIYRRRADGLTLEGADFGGGRIMVSGLGDSLTFTPTYFLTDHLGSTRAVVQLTDGAPRVLERNDYLPFGKRWEQPNSAISDNRFRFSGKEDQTTGSLPYQDFGARFYNGLTFNTLDPLSGIRPWESPYMYAGNNPIRNIDPTGMDWVSYWDEEEDEDGWHYTRQYEWRDDVTSMDNTPDWYSYVGANDSDILDNMGLSDIYSVESSWSPYLSFGSELSTTQPTSR